VQKIFTLSFDKCLGRSDIYVDQYEKHPNVKSHTWQGQDDQQGVIVDMRVTHVDPIGFYIGIQPTDDKSSTELSYRLTAHTTNPPPSPKLSDRTITPAPFANAITLSWPPATPAQSGDTLKYLVYYASYTSDTIMSSECGLTTSGTIYGKALDHSPQMSVTLTNINAAKYIFNVLVYDQNGQFGLYKDTGPLTIPSSDSPDGSSLPISWILGIGIPVFLITIVAIVYLVIRNRKLTKELEIEMHDVPKAVVRKAVRGPTEPEPAPNSEMKQNKKSDKKYSRLLTDDDEEEDYAPPDFSNEI